MSRGSRDDCQDKLDRYNAAKNEYNAFLDDMMVYQASYDQRVAQMINEDIPAKDKKIDMWQGKSAEINALLNGSNKNEALAAPGRINEIDQRLEQINKRLNEIMRLLDGVAEASQVQVLLSEGDNLAEERDGLLDERITLVTLIQRYNGVVEQVEQLDQEIKALQAEVAQMESELALAEEEAKADRWYIEDALMHLTNRKHIMLEIEGLWDDFDCREYFGELSGFNEKPMIDEEDIPDDEEPIDTGDYEVPESLDEPDDPGAGEEWNPGDYDDPIDTG